MDYPVLTVPKKHEAWVENHALASAGPRPNVTGMRRLWGADCPIIRCGQYIYRMYASDYLSAKWRNFN